MTEYIITAPSGYSGKVGAVVFIDGHATADSDTHVGELSYCRNTDGYTVTAAAEAPPATGDGDGEAPKNPDGDGLKKPDGEDGADSDPEPPEVPEEPEAKKTRTRAKKA